MEISVDQKEMKLQLRQKTAMPLLWIGIVSIVMFFAALTSAVIVSKSSGNWQLFKMPITFLYSTITIVLSSVSYWFAIKAAKNNQLTALKNGVLLTLLFGVLFAVLQFVSWSRLLDQEIFLVGSVSGSYLYVLTAFHLAHLTGGIISLIVVYIKSISSVYNSENLLGLQLSSTYWHFLGGLWVYLYLFLNFIAL